MSTESNKALFLSSTKDNDMADTTRLPDEIWVHIASFLDNEDLARFRQICKVTQFVGSHAILLQPFYNRLYALDKTLPAVLSQDKAFLDFTEAFLKIDARQQEEIAYLQEHQSGLRAKVEYHEVFSPTTLLTLASLEAKDAVLDKINGEIITRKINVRSTSLFLRAAKITRLPASLFQAEGYVNFWQNLVSLDCRDNDLITLNLQALTALQNIDCTFNKLTTLNVQGLTALLHLRCFNNQLTILDAKGLVALQSLWCNNNRLTSLDVQGKASLQYLFCDKNPLKDLNLTGVHADTKNRYADLEKSLLWKQLSAANSHEEQQRIITRLGVNFSFENCLNYCPDQVEILFPIDAFPQETSYLPSFSSTSSTVEKMDEDYKNNKRARPEEEGDLRPDEFKRSKKM